jgi:putative PEP-CTERM system histidine kinase
MIDIGAASYGVGALAWFVVGVLLMAGRRAGSRAGAVLIGACLVNTLWALTLALHSHFGETWELLPNLLEPLRDLAWGSMLILLLQRGGVAPGLSGFTWIRAALAAGCVVLILLSVLVRQLATGLSPTGPLAMQVGGYLGMAVFLLWLNELLFRNTRPDDRWGIKFLCFGVGGLFAYDFLLYSDALLFRELNPTLWQARGAVNALAAPLIAVAAARYHDFALNAHVSRRAVYHTASLTAVGVYLLFMAGAGYYLRVFGGEWGDVLQVVFLFGALLGLLALVFSGQLRARLRVFLSRHFFSFRYDYREQWLNLTQTLAASHGLVEAREAALRALAGIVESPGGQLWLRDGSAFRPLAYWNMPTVKSRELEQGSLARFLALHGWVIDLDEYRDSPERYVDLQRPAWLNELSQAWLIVPLATQGDLRGFAVLTAPLAHVAVDWEVRDILKTAASQVSSHLAQIANAAQVAESRQFAGFHRLSAFVLHDLKNLVSQQSVVVSRVARHRHNPAFVDDIAHILEHSVRKMQRLMDLLKGGVSAARPLRLELAHVLEEAVKNRRVARPAPVLDVYAAPLCVHADHDRLLSVLEHLLQNAQDATADEGSVRVTLGESDDQALIEIEDTGCGMDERFVHDRLFRPFDTTKGDTGMGIGAYESREYARALGGELEVESTPGVGTRFRLVLPLASAGTAQSLSA